jgi:hypothetical protein
MTIAELVRKTHVDGNIAHVKGHITYQGKRDSYRFDLELTMPSTREGIEKYYEETLPEESRLLEKTFKVTNKHGTQVPLRHSGGTFVYFLMFGEEGSDYEFGLTPELPPNFTLQEPIERIGGFYEMLDYIEDLFELTSEKEISDEKIRKRLSQVQS